MGRRAVFVEVGMVLIQLQRLFLIKQNTQEKRNIKILIFLENYYIIFLQNELRKKSRKSIGIILSSNALLTMLSRKPTKSAGGIRFARRSSRDKG